MVGLSPACLFLRADFSVVGAKKKYTYISLYIYIYIYIYIEQGPFQVLGETGRDPDRHYFEIGRRFIRNWACPT